MDRSVGLVSVTITYLCPHHARTGTTKTGTDENEECRDPRQHDFLGRIWLDAAVEGSWYRPEKPLWSCHCCGPNMSTHMWIHTCLQLQGPLSPSGRTELCSCQPPFPHWPIPCPSPAQGLPVSSLGRKGKRGLSLEETDCSCHPHGTGLAESHP